MAAPFKPNIYPILYWAIAYGVIAGFLLFLLLLLSRYITFVWFPVFLVGLVWGGYRNYRKQKRIWSTQSGVPVTPKGPIEEFREAVSDVVDASREMVVQHRAEDEEIAAAEAAATDEEAPVTPEEQAAYEEGFQEELTNQKAADAESPAPTPGTPERPTP